MPSNRKTIKTLGSSRVVYLFGEIKNKSVKKCIKRLVELDKKSGKDILLVIDSIGGDVDGLVSIHQVMQLLRCDVATLVLSSACSAACLLLACGAPGKRFVMRSSILMLHDLRSELSDDSHRALEQEMVSLGLSRQIMCNLLESHGAAPAVKFLKSESTYFLGAKAIEMGIADVMIERLDDILKVANI